MKAAAKVQGVRASYNQLYCAIDRAVMKAQREKQQASFGLIILYLHQFQLQNEDSTVKAESDADKHLQCLGICPGVMKHSLKHARPVLSLDGAHLKRKGLIHALQQVFPDNHHCCCSIHIARNVEKAFGKQLAKHVHDLLATFSKRESDNSMTKINGISVRGEKCLEDITANQWRNTAWVDNLTLPPRFGIVTINMSESMFGDARDGSWLECTNAIVRTMMNRICTLWEKLYGREVLWRMLQKYLRVDGKTVLASK
ncbi:transposase, mutator family protein [Nitzschia inconspicua]|uniref:Transposase, mutator family protein n=1 Tax=Nitzschia inconspicua TaxID=303405 RepID=A0A9K3LDC7_9STRA|nr:transposase, mutator family protein [Nitzschia inconspicua]KAG7359977.1 transposase, mutator family protein [Nitzschia inconspicua]